MNSYVTPQPLPLGIESYGRATINFYKHPNLVIGHTVLPFPEHISFLWNVGTSYFTFRTVPLSFMKLSRYAVFPFPECILTSYNFALAKVVISLYSMQFLSSHLVKVHLQLNTYIHPESLCGLGSDSRLCCERSRVRFF